MKPEEIELDPLLLDLQSMHDDLEAARKRFFEKNASKMTAQEKLRFEIQSQQVVNVRIAIKRRIEELLNGPN